MSDDELMMNFKMGLIISTPEIVDKHRLTDKA